MDPDDDETPRSGFEDTKSDDSTHGGYSDDDDDAISGVSGASYDEADEVPFARSRHNAAEAKEAQDRQAMSLDLMRRISYQAWDIEQGQLPTLISCHLLSNATA